MNADQRGSAALVVLAVVAVTAMLAVVIGNTGIYLNGRARAAAAADAAALAAAPVTFLPFGAMGSPRQEAARFANANGARLIRCTCPVDRSFADREVVVGVSITVVLWGLGSRSVAATSRARFSPSKLGLAPLTDPAPWVPIR